MTFFNFEFDYIIFYALVNKLYPSRPPLFVVECVDDDVEYAEDSDTWVCGTFFKSCFSPPNDEEVSLDSDDDGEEDDFDDDEDDDITLLLLFTILLSDVTVGVCCWLLIVVGVVKYETRE